MILQPVRLSSFTAISISSATRIPQETCWIPQETCLLAKKALAGFRKKLACWTKSERRLLARADPARTFSRAGAARALFSRKKGLLLDARDHGSSRSSSLNHWFGKRGQRQRSIASAHGDLTNFA